MFFLIMLGVIAIGSAVIVLGNYILEKTDFDMVGVMCWILGGVGMCAGVMMLIAYSIAATSAPIKAKLINDAYGTSYTTEDLIWGDGIITEVIQGKKSRVDLTVENKE